MYESQYHVVYSLSQLLVVQGYFCICWALEKTIVKPYQRQSLSAGLFLCIPLAVAVSVSVPGSQASCVRGVKSPADQLRDERQFSAREIDFSYLKRQTRRLASVSALVCNLYSNIILYKLRPIMLYLNM